MADDATKWNKDRINFISDLSRIAGHLQGYSDVLEQTVEFDRDALIEGLREDSATLQGIVDQALDKDKPTE